MATLMIAFAGLALACAPVGGPGGGGTLPAPIDNSAGNVADPTNLPLGDYHVSATTPAVGTIYSCSLNVGGGGAAVDGPWIRSNGTWDSTAKIAVQGSVAWPTANVSITESAGRRIISGNALPVGHSTGTFPIAATDPAYQYDHNPNSITTHPVSVSLPLDPAIAANPGCTSGGPIGYATNGVAIFNGFDAGDRDAVAHEVQDGCGGHPEPTGTYHYHSGSDCIPGATNPTSTLIGYALDGFGIYNRFDENGHELSNDDLDVCHGRTSPVLWNGTVQNVYHYVATRAFPYTIGCYRGTPGA